MNENIYLDLKINEDDYLTLKTCILESIRRYKGELYDENISEDNKKLKEKVLNDFNRLLKNLEVCEMYNEKFYKKMSKYREEAEKGNFYFDIDDFDL